MEKPDYAQDDPFNGSSFGNYTDMETISVITRLNIGFIVTNAILVCIGVVGNSATMIIICRRKDFHTATFTAIGLLALVDLLAVCFRAILLVHDINNAQGYYALTLSLNSTNGVLTATFVLYVCSCMHVVMLARLRYKLLAYPIQGMSIMRTHVIRESILAWIASCVLGIPYGLKAFLLPDLINYISEIIVCIAICLCTVIPIVTFHILKIRKIREGITARANTMRTMNRMVTLICLVQTVSITSVPVQFLILFINGTLHAERYISWTVVLLLLVNHVMNPLLFFYFTTCRRLLDSTRNNRVHVNQQRDTRV